MRHAWAKRRISSFWSFLRTFLDVGAVWNGDALGFARSSRTVVHALLTLASFVPGNAVTPGGNKVGNFGHQFEVFRNNDDSVQYSFVNTHLEFQEGPRDGPGIAAEPFLGASMGPNAEEEFGAFRTRGYHASFGLQRERCPAWAVHPRVLEA